MTDRIAAKVRQTKHYEKFNVYKGNRGHEPKDLRGLMSSLDEHGWWNSMPMTVRQNGSAETFDIKDGHTRFQAAIDLGIPVKYVVVNEFDDEHISGANSNQKTWTSKDHAKSWAHLGYKDYQQLLEFMSDYHVALTTAVILLTQSAVRMTQVISSGQFKINDETWAQETLNYIVRMNAAIPFSAKKQKFVIAFIRARQVEEFDPERFVYQVTKNAELVKDFSSAHDTAQNFEEVYNYRRAAKNQIPLAFSMQQIQKGE